MIAATQEQLAKVHDILQQLDEQLLGKDADNRRKADRVVIRMPMSLTLLASESTTPIDVFSRNISSSGMGFISRRLFRAEERIAVSLRLAGLPSKLILARITFGRYLRGGLYEMGAEFLECVTNPGGQASIPNHWVMGAHQARNAHPLPNAAPAPAAHAAAPAENAPAGDPPPAAAAPPAKAAKAKSKA